MSNYFDQMPTASDASRLTFSPNKFKKLYPEYFRFFRREVPKDGQTLEHWYQRFDQHLLLGDTRAAVVVSLDPLLVAAYTDELDCVAMLKFPIVKGVTDKLPLGKRLLTVNTYQNYAKVVSDLEPGPNNTEGWENFDPMIADFFSSNPVRFATLKKGIHQDEWTHTRELGERYLVEKPNYVRDGCPLYSMFPGTPQNDSTQPRVSFTPPNFSVSPAALEQIRLILPEDVMPVDPVVYLEITCQHPEIYERQVTFAAADSLSPDDDFLFEIEGCKFATPKDAAHAYDNTVLGFNAERNGFLFHKQSLET